jgi:hypothetical protein
MSPGRVPFQFELSFQSRRGFSPVSGQQTKSETVLNGFSSKLLLRRRAEAAA